MHFEPESRNGDPKGPAFAEILENYCDANMAEERRVSSLVQNRKVRFARRNTSGLCRRLGMSSRSGNTKRGSKGVSGCREN